MITHEQLVELGGWQGRTYYEYIFDNWEYLYNSKTNTFWNINDGFGEPELIVDRVRDYEHLKEILTALNLDI
jgi:hypothetical protein